MESSSTGKLPPSSTDTDTKESVARGVLSPANSSSKREKRCETCPGCLKTDDCLKCVYCKDMKKYGGSGKQKQTCISRKCVMVCPFAANW